MYTVGVLVRCCEAGNHEGEVQATAVSESSETIEEVYEPFLIQQGFIIRTPRGREVTELAYKHLGRQKSDYQKGLF